MATKPPVVESSAVKTRECVFTVSVHPSALADPLAGAKTVLDGLLMRHVSELGGVLMSRDRERLYGGDDDDEEEEEDLDDGTRGRRRGRTGVRRAEVAVIRDDA